MDFFPLLLTFSVGDAYKWPVQFGALIQWTNYQSGFDSINDLPVQFWPYVSRNAKGWNTIHFCIENIGFYHRLKCCLESLEKSCLENIVDVRRTEKH